MSFSIRSAEAGDEGEVLRLVRELAAYERLLDQAVASEADIRAGLFSDHPRVFCDLAESEGRAVGFALWFYSYSTFVGRHGIYLEDLFVEPAARGQGIGKALLERLAGRCLAERLGRFEWAVLDWNQPSIDFYRSQGAVLLNDWRICRVTGEALAELGRRGGG